MGSDIAVYVRENANTVILVIAPSGELAKTVPTTTCELQPEEAIEVANLLLNSGVATLRKKLSKG